MSPRSPQSGSLARYASVTGLVLALATACDSADEDPGATDTEDAETESASEGDAQGTASITVTVEDGTVYELDVRSCDTSVTDPSALPLSNGYILSGQTPDGGIDLFVSRAGLDDESVFESGSIEGDFDENGLNARMVYSFLPETLTLQIDGGTVMGSVSARAVGPTRPHGDNPVFTIEASCE